MAVSGVFPCYENQFAVKIGEEFKEIKECESFSLSFDNNVEEWSPFDQKGWKKRLMTGKGFTISVSAKRSVGDPGNDEIASKAFKNGRDAEADFQWTFPDGTKVVMEGCVISVTELGTGDSTNVAPLTFDVMSNGKPTITEPAAG